MKRKEIIQLLLIAVVTMMFTACAASRRAVSDNHQEVKDSVSAIQQDSVHQQVMVNDSVAIKVSEDKHTSSSSKETGEYEETIQEQITETTDSSGNKQTTTNRTTHRKGSYNNQSSYDERLQMQQQKSIRCRRPSIALPSVAVMMWTPTGRPPTVYQIRRKRIQQRQERLTGFRKPERTPSPFSAYRDSFGTYSN